MKSDRAAGRRACRIEVGVRHATGTVQSATGVIAPLKGNLCKTLRALRAPMTNDQQNQSQCQSAGVSGDGTAEAAKGATSLSRVAARGRPFPPSLCLILSTVDVHC